MYIRCGYRIFGKYSGFQKNRIFGFPSMPTFYTIVPYRGVNPKCQKPEQNFDLTYEKEVQVQNQRKYTTLPYQV